ncbi:hypothetical protein KL930_004742 [Ogataea haglerorum]|uniref:Uncharacterized protein n=1 Tax=Ogataea haglerorum TaxID=1937702 RepID=A0AAN6HZI8_9ASCO|nr:uncharacterized protein KL911_004473 [Ogataea haglerorum]KAG7693173.1 hypothetical protein KL951_004712 [Ogataea haglerorum]KAG7693582.1 hypothetical protein KL915_003872 [Ogataea haglerorum]KAG7703415.1 hypothetical protein KL914_004800 [Ogataea haglerorum]KAG7703736.1 hypothetical protein KL950_004533 [Ogataea haglerorum]KAG7714418.1 hypothetical protein KL913_004615 [Ogataea haglerorum]
MFYELKDWSSVASTDRSHPLIFETARKPCYIMADVGHSQQDDRFLEDLLKRCDLTGLRQKHYQDVVRKQVREELLLKSRFLRLASKVRGSSYVDARVDKYIRAKGILTPGQYPIVQKPILKRVECNDLGLKYNFDMEALEIENQEKLRQEAMDADILYLEAPNKGKLYIRKVTCLLDKPSPFLMEACRARIRKRTQYFDRLLGEKHQSFDEFEYRLLNQPIRTYIK